MTNTLLRRGGKEVTNALTRRHGNDETPTITPSATTPKKASDVVTAPRGGAYNKESPKLRKRLLAPYTGEAKSRRWLNNPSVRRVPRLPPSRAVESVLGQETAQTMCRFQARKWSTPHRGVDKKAFARPLHRGDYIEANSYIYNMDKKGAGVSCFLRRGVIE